MHKSAEDKYKFKPQPNGIDSEPLGAHPNLPVLDKAYARQAFSFLDKDNLSDRERAALFLIRRIADYYKVIGYVGCELTNDSLELGRALGDWGESGCFEAYRTCYVLTLKEHWVNPARIFSNVRYACFESALRLAAWEVSQEVPESEQALRYAAALAYRSIRMNTSKKWVEIRRRNGTKRMRKELDHVLYQLKSQTLVQSNYWLGTFEPKPTLTVNAA
ncbi:hypothetical protein [Vibrio sp. R78045]|uniref:hypothetical protein n=1 Tax=Vibrio sp. R78045 TaxID=3093868 RepID=UPI0036F27767